MPEPVKGKTEAGRRREERARQRRQRIVAAAQELFPGRGYIATTIEEIARVAGVAPATVYQAFGSKQAILARLLDVTIAGDQEPGALLERDWVSQARQEPSPQRRLALVVGRAAEVAARTAALKEVMRDAAAADPVMRELIGQDHARRYLTHQALVDIAIDGAALRPGCTREHAVSTFYALVNSHSYLVLAGHLGWRLPDWQEWLTGVLSREFFG